MPPENALVLGCAAGLAPYSVQQRHLAPCMLQTGGDTVSSDHKIQRRFWASQCATSVATNASKVRKTLLTALPGNSPHSHFRDVVDATMNYAAHIPFVNKCVAKYANEGKFPSCNGPDQTDEDHSYRSCTCFLRGTWFTPGRLKCIESGSYRLRISSSMYSYGWRGGRCTEQTLLVSGTHLFCNRRRVNRNSVSKQREGYDVPALSSAKRAPTRSECFKNLSAQCERHCSYSGNKFQSQAYDEGVASYLF